MSKLTTAQHKHFHELVFLLEKLAEPKYEAGAKEHGGNLWEMTDEELEYEELKEMLDLLTYRLTRILKRQKDEPRRY